MEPVELPGVLSQKRAAFAVHQLAGVLNRESETARGCIRPTARSSAGDSVIRDMNPYDPPGIKTHNPRRSLTPAQWAVIVLMILLALRLLGVT